ncbi:MAG TPA: hypothetical protein VGK40_10025 [Verrucomicrobiae bacterium]|jgi:hypothetical protein
MNSENTTAKSIPESKPTAYGLSQLNQIKLPDHDEAFLTSLAARLGGSPRWRAHKQMMTRQMLALAQITDRLKLHWLDVAGDFRVLFDLRVTVPCLPDPHGPLQIASSATIGLTYREEFLAAAQPGYVYISLIRPAAIWLANSATDFGQPLCLGPKLEAGIPVKELIIATYLALSMQSYQFNERDSAGILNGAAATWWQHQKSHPIPLSNEPFVTKTIPTNTEPKA